MDTIIADDFFLYFKFCWVSLSLLDIHRSSIAYVAKFYGGRRFDSQRFESINIFRVKIDKNPNLLGK